MCTLLPAVISRQRAQSELQKTILPEIALPVPSGAEMVWFDSTPIQK